MPTTETLSAVETHILDLVYQVQILVTKRNLLQPEYLELVTLLRDMKIMLQNKKFGCVQGIHGSACTCSSKLRGRPISSLKAAQRCKNISSLD